MKKRLVTTLFSVICAASLALSLTACEDENNGSNKNNGNNGNNQQPTIGVDVTKEQWDLAFERACNATNFTCVAEVINEDWNFVYEDFFNVEAEFDLFRKITDKDSETEEFIYVLQKDEHSAPYYISRDLEVEKITNILGTYDTGISYMSLGFSDNPDILNDDIIISRAIWEFYSEFEFVDGEYRADNLYCFRGHDTEAHISKVTVKIDDDGYLRYYSVEFEVMADTQMIKCKYSCKLDNYGTTQVEVPKEILYAIEKYENKNN